MRHSRPAGFTIVELLVVMLIIMLISVVALPALYSAYVDTNLKYAASGVKSMLDQTNALASAYGKSGIRLLPDPTFTPSRLADGRIDPAQPIVFSRMVGLSFPQDYTEGLVNVRPTTGMTADLINWAANPPANSPEVYVPLYNRLLVESAAFDEVPYPDHPEGRANNPTSWFWNVRVGEKIWIENRYYTICGPVRIPNPQGFVNVGVAGTASPLNRGLYPAEFLLVTNQIDDDDDGYVDNGWDGIDNDLDSPDDAKIVGVSKGIDEEDESEPEAWDERMRLSGAQNSPYRIVRRPYEDMKRVYSIPSGYVVDGTGWDYLPYFNNAETWTDRSGVVRAQPGWDYSFTRSRMPVDPFLGTVDFIFDNNGVTTSGPYYNGFPIPLDQRYFHLWIASVKDATAPPPAMSDGFLVTINPRTNRVTTGDAQGSDVQGSFTAMEQ